MPAEWEPHAACWMGWPQAALWGGDLKAAEADYARVAQAVAQFEPVRMLADPSSAARARRALGNSIEVIEMPLDDAWLRDSGPAFVRTGDAGLAAVHWRFNGWGGANTAFTRDAAVGRGVAEHLGVPVIPSALAMEGGAIAVDGAGTLLATDTVTFNANRNPGLSRSHAEAEFARTLGIRKVIWLPGDPHEYGTDGHIDGIACFIRPGALLFETDGGGDPAGAAINAANRAVLEAATDADGRPLELFDLPGAPAMPGKQGVGDWGYCRSYVNFYIANGGIVMPGFGIKADSAARAAVQQAFPDREVVQIRIDTLAAGGGGIHCITQQEPALPTPESPEIT
ncbi:MAG: agmatine deiminase family protein [Rhodobacteraceae bacterium]|nr:agmatine deiminase family protein [Paracoccaceae bacterium]